jgi:drug/metabolite transporter (DMT)-like permease
MKASRGYNGSTQWFLFFGLEERETMNKYAYAGLMLGTTFLMGVAFPVGKIGLFYATPFLLMGIRFVLAGGTLALITAKRRQPQGAKQWLQAAAVGMLQSAGVMGCAYYSMHWITSGESAIITFANPLLVVIFSTLFAVPGIGRCSGLASCSALPASCSVSGYTWGSSRGPSSGLRAPFASRRLRC